MDEGPSSPPKPRGPNPPYAAEGSAGGSVTLVHAVGMHARPAVKLTKLAKRFRARIVVRVAGATEWIDAKSVAKVMSMRAPCDSVIEFAAFGADARAAIGALTALIANDFSEVDS
jgi:phosphocarrier protein HPr